MKISINALCPCFSGKKYKKCCQIYHNGVSPSNALLLMRSRYSAFALHLNGYIIDTTHPTNPDYTQDTKEWERGISEFCDITDFTGLEIIEFMDGENEAFVKFKASLGDMHFIEKSRFLKEENRWFYESGEFVT